MNFHLRRGGLYVFWSIYKKIMKLFIHSHKGYESLMSGYQAQGHWLLEINSAWDPMPRLYFW
jgi:hypothetical protein